MLEAIFSYNTLYWLIQIVYLPSCIGLIIIVLLQKGKSMGFAGAFGANPGGDTVLGPRASRSLPVRMTYFMAGAFMVLALLMAIIEGRRQEGVAPDLVDAEELARINQNIEDLEAMGVNQADTEGEEPVGEMEPATGEIEDAADIDIDAAADVEPEAPAGDSTPETEATDLAEEQPADTAPAEESDAP